MRLPSLLIIALIATLLKTGQAAFADQTLSTDDASRKYQAQPYHPLIRGKSNDDRWNWLIKHLRELATCTKEEALKLCEVPSNQPVGESLCCQITTDLSKEPLETLYYDMCLRFRNGRVSSVTISPCNIQRSPGIASP